jgi:hypothetical protein
MPVLPYPELYKDAPFVVLSDWVSSVLFFFVFFFWFEVGFARLEVLGGGEEEEEH